MGAQQSYTLADVRQRAEADDADFAIQAARLGLPASSGSHGAVDAAIDGAPHAKLVQLLTGLGVPPAAGVPDADLKAMLKLAVQSDSWRRLWAHHPNADLLREWMCGHVEFRKLLACMRQAVSGDADLTAAQVGDINGQLQAFLKKNEPHSDFEDTQLFPFFKEAYPQFAQFWLEVDNEHGRFDQLVAKATEAIAAGVSGGASGDARKSLASAVAELASFYEGHLLLEERLLVPLWLNVTEAQKADLKVRLQGIC